MKKASDFFGSFGLMCMIFAAACADSQNWHFPVAIALIGAAFILLGNFLANKYSRGYCE